jgi:GLPGLI family protein
MKKTILFLGVITMLIAAHVVFGQDGVITYEVRINLHRTLPSDRDGMKAMIPEFRIFKQQLFFNAEVSMYKPLIEEEEEDNGGGGRVIMRFRQPEIYCNQHSGKIISVQDLMGKTYLVDDSVKVAPWKLGDETKTVLGYECKQAYYADDERKQTITAWYTDKLRPFLGPDRFNTLPGAVLAVDVNNGERVLVATKVESRPLRKNEIKEPTSGQRTTPTEFRKMMDAQRTNMRNGQVIIRN